MSKNIGFTVVRWLLAAAAVVMLVFSGSAGSFSSTPAEEIEKAVTAQMDMSSMQKGDNQRIKRFYGLNPADFEDCILYYPNTNMMAEELLIIRLADVSQQELVKKAAERRVQTQKTTFEGYGPEQFQLLSEHAVIEVRGNYVLFAVCSNSDQVRTAFLDAL